ncbi:hypothetical protein KAU32_07175, partial [bacterium]|nr:hypothetical protein [bacterium]
SKLFWGGRPALPGSRGADAGRKIKQWKVSSRGSWRPWDPVLFHPGSHFTLQTAFIVGISVDAKVAKYNNEMRDGDLQCLQST